MVKSMKDKGVVPGLMNELVDGIYNENPKQYQSYAINPSKLLHHSTVIGEPEIGDEDEDNTESTIFISITWLSTIMLNRTQSKIVNKHQIYL